MATQMLLALRLCLLGLLVNMKPSEPYLSLYLNDTKGLSSETLATQVYPWSTLGAFIFLLPMALLSEVVGCRPVILLGLLFRTATRVLLIFGEGAVAMAIMQLAYAAADASMNVYFAYVYCVGTTDHYALLTSMVFAAYHGGNVAGAVVAELCVRVLRPDWLRDLTPLFYMSWGTTTLGLLAFCALPRPLHAPPVSLARVLMHSGLRETVRELLALWSSVLSQRWLLWWVLALSGQSLIVNYFQLSLLEEGEDVPFGLLEGSLELGLLLGSVAAVPAMQLASSRPLVFLSSTSLVRATALIVAARCAVSKDVGGAFAFNGLAAVIFGLQRSVGSAQVAQATSRHHHGCASQPSSSLRFPLLFSANALCASATASAVSGVGAAAAWTSHEYYIAAAAGLGCVAVVAPLIRCAEQPELARLHDTQPQHANEGIGASLERVSNRCKILQFEQM